MTLANSAPFNIEGFDFTGTVMNDARANHTATPLLDDRILIAGGENPYFVLNRTEFYDPSTNSLSDGPWMAQARSHHTATALFSGKVLITGGSAILGYIGTSTAEIFDPATNSMISISSMNHPRKYHTATLLPDGRVLIAGGEGGSSSAEIFDPATNTFTATANMNAAHTGHPEILLPNGKVLIAGGTTNSSEIFDPATGIFSLVGSALPNYGDSNPLSFHSAVLLNDGKVLITGGSSTSLTAAFLFDPEAGSFAQVGPMNFPHRYHQSVLLRDGSVLIVGADDWDSAEIYDPTSGTFRLTGTIWGGRANCALTVLPSGLVLLTGGDINSVGTDGSDRTEVWRPLNVYNSHVISGTITTGTGGMSGVFLMGLPGLPMTNGAGYYEGVVLDGWGGTVTPTKPGYIFNPANQTYIGVSTNIPIQNYTVTSGPAIPSKLAFVQQPTNAAVNAPLTPAVTVEIQDTFGNLVTTATNRVDLSLRLAGTAILSGTLFKDAVGGIATFNDLIINAAGTGYLLRANSDSLTEVDSSTFDITSPEIGIRQNTANIPDGGNFDFGSHVSGSTTDLTFTVENTGTGALIFSGLPIVMGGVDADSFSVQQQPATPVSPGGSTSFVIRFSPTSPGTKTASISIANNDPDEHPYDIVFQGAATAAMVAVAGTITYNDSPITSKTSATPTFLMEDVSTGLPAVFTSTYNNSTGGYSINVAPGTYHITAHFDTALPTNGTFMPGDYYCMQNDVVIPSGGMTLNLGCQLLMHMTSPIDNLTPQTWEYGSLGGELTFIWDAVPEAAKYRVEIHKYTDAGIYEGNAISPADISAPTTQFSCTLPLNGPDKHYRLILRAFKGDVYASTMVGMLIVVYDSPNWSNVYRFKSRGLIAYYPFRGNANDESGYGNNGTINGGAVFATDRFGAANGSMTFDGVDDYVELPNEGWFDLSQITIVSIVKISDLATSVPVISKGIDFGSFTVRIGNSPGLRPEYLYRTSTGNESEPLSGAAVPLNEFFQLVSTYDPATRQLCGYVNGVRRVNLTAMATPMLNDQNVTIGLYVVSDPPPMYRHFVGTMDEIRIYNRILSPSEVLALYNATGDGDYELVTKWGSSGTGNGQFDHAFGVAVDNSGYVYVADTDNHRIQKFTTEQIGDFVTTWGGLGTGDGQFNYPKGIAVDNSGFVYVAEYGNHRVQKFSSLGTFVTKWGSYGTTGDGEFQGPGGIAVDNSGNVYVADTYNHRIQKFTSDGTFITKWGSQGSENGQFNYPWGIGIDRSGEIFVADSLNRRIQKFTSDGTFMTEWGTQGSGDDQFEQPAGLAVDGSGYVYVVDYSNHRVQKFTSGGQFVVKWGSLGSGNGQFVYPSGIAVDASGYIYVNDTNNFRIQKFRKK